MNHSQSKYYVEVREDGVAKRVPHTGKKHTDFLDRKKASDFHKELVANNAGYSFRLCKMTETFTDGPWITQPK
jgi:hypothetical protein